MTDLSDFPATLPAEAELALREWYIQKKKLSGEKLEEQIRRVMECQFPGWRKGRG